MLSAARLPCFAVILFLFSALTDGFCETATLFPPNEPYATHSIRTFNGVDWEYQNIDFNIRAGQIFDQEYRAFVRFDLSEFPPEAVIESVFLGVYVVQASTDPSIRVDLHALTLVPNANNMTEVANAMGATYFEDWDVMLDDGPNAAELNAAAAQMIHETLIEGRSDFMIGFTGSNIGLQTEGTIAGYDTQTPPVLTVTYHVPFIAPPAEVTAALTPNDEIELSWTDQSDDEDRFEIVRCYRLTEDAECEHWLLLDTVPANVTMLVDPDLESGFYQYRVRSANDEANSVWVESNLVGVVFPPAAPAAINAAFDPPDQIGIEWIDDSFDEAGFVLEGAYRPIDGEWSDYAVIDEALPPNTESYSYAVPAPGDFQFRIAAFNDAGVSDWAVSSPLFVPPLPEAPADFEGSYDEQNRVALTWTDNAAYEDNFRLERRHFDTDWTDWSLLGVLPMNSVSHLDQSFPAGHLLQYRIRSENLAGSSVWIVTELEASGISADRAELPSTTELLNCYPNPFNPTTTVRFRLARTEAVSLELFNLNGSLVRNLLHSALPAGEHAFRFDGSGMAGGVYFLRLRTADVRQQRQIILLK